jgi:putative peptide modification system cyclase
MNALLNPSPAPTPQAAAIPLLRTLVLCDIVDSTALTQRLGDQRAADLFRKHDRLARALLQAHGGREIDKTDGFLLMFERPVQAVAFALDYQRALRDLNQAEGSTLATRVGIHVGDVVAWDNSPEDIARGAKPIEVEGLVKPITSRLMQLALPNQILLSGVAHALAHRAQGELGERLETIRWRTHGRYRFKGVPDPIPVFEVGDEGFAPLKAPPWSGKAHREVPFWRRPATLGIELAALLLVLAIPAWYVFKPNPAIAFANRDWVVVGDLNNLTGDTRLDESVETAFRISLEQSRYVNVLSSLKVRETVALMRRDPKQTPIDRTVGAEIALRDGARALILPTIAEVGGRVRVTVEVVDPQTLTTVYSESVDGVGEDSVLPSLDQVNQKLRVRLGEAVVAVRETSSPLDKVATDDLDALKAYTLGMQKENSGDYGDALALYRQAVKLDAQFAFARVAIARTYFGAGDNAAAEKELDAAVTMKDRLPVRDATYLEAWHASLVAPATSLQKWRLLSTMYPDFSSGQGMYAYLLWQQHNRYAEAIGVIEKSLDSPNTYRSLGLYLLGVLYLGMERYDDALRQFGRAEENGFADTGFHAVALAVRRKFTEADEIIRRSRDSGVAGMDSGRERRRALFALDQGRVEEAVDILAAASKGVEAASQEQEALDVIRLSAAALLGPVPAADLRTRLRPSTRSRPVGFDRFDADFRQLVVAYLAARQKDVDLALATKVESVEGFPMLSAMKKLVDAQVAIAQGKPAAATKLIEPMIDGDEPYLAHIVLMDAYAAAGDAKSAIIQANWLSTHRGRAYTEYNSNWLLTAFYVGQSDLALLRAAELHAQSGDATAAQRSLSEFRQAWPAPAQGVRARIAALDASSH